MNSRSLAGVLPSLILTALTGIIAGAVQHFAAPAGGIRAAWQSNWPGNPAVRTGGQDYPRQAIDSDAFTVSVPGPARRIVSQYWSIDDYVYSVAPPEHVIAVSETAYVPGISNVYHHVQRFRPAIATDLERVLRLSPDLLIVSNSSRADYCAIVRSAGMPIYRAFTMFTTLEELAETIRLTGYLTGEDLSCRCGSKSLLGRHRGRESQAAAERASAAYPGDLRTLRLGTPDGLRRNRSHTGRHQRGRRGRAHRLRRRQ